jgi:hypothetical protein
VDEPGAGASAASLTRPRQSRVKVAIGTGDFTGTLALARVGLAGHRDHGTRYPNGEIGAAAYELGHAEGEKERHGEEGGESGGGEPEAEATAPKRGRGRPRKEAQPELSEADEATQH